VRLGSITVILARPQTFMNHSGEAVSALMRQEEAPPDELIVICDDIYLDLGVIRLRAHGSHGGHNGLRSVVGALGTVGFARLRVGVGPARPGVDHADFVLSPFPKRDRETVREVVSLAADCAEMAAGESVQSAMNRFNARPVPGGPGIEGAS
jgi:PTH1 family peptidyl-tRNA hydrolase